MRNLFVEVTISWYFHQPHLMWSTLVDFYFLQESKYSLQSKEFEEMLDLALKSLKALKLDKIRVKKQNR